ncbi:MAG: hypothetical protein M3Q07_19270 [Pseudobdellovibrionaceae bacterium]|nr:hypothetical protein [Pseudobdellovibrionaceae bacterium]
MAAYQELAATHKALGQFEQAFRYLELFVELQKELLAEDANKKYMQLRNQTLSEQNELQAQQIELLSKFRIVSIIAGSLAFLVCGALLMVGRQAAVIKRSRQKMKEVLDHIEEGILLLDEKLQIRSGYSPHLDKIFSREPRSLEGTSFPDLLFPTVVAPFQITRKIGLSLQTLAEIPVIMVSKARTGNPYNLMHGRLTYARSCISPLKYYLHPWTRSSNLLRFASKNSSKIMTFIWNSPSLYA